MSDFFSSLWPLNTLSAACHQASGEGLTAPGAPELTDDIWLYGSTRGSIEETITHGRRGVMPAHAQLLAEHKVHVLPAYLYGLSNG